MKNKKIIVLLVVSIILIFIICFTIMFERKNNNSVLLNIENIENKTEEIKESEITNDSTSLIPGNAVIADDVVNESFTMYNYKFNK